MAEQAVTKSEHRILFQQYFKSVGPRTYAAQLKEAGNGNHYLVLTESKRDKGSDEPRKTRLFVFSEDFPAFVKMFGEAARFIAQHPVPAEVKAKRQRFWAKGKSNSFRKKWSPKPDATRRPAGSAR